MIKECKYQSSLTPLVLTPLVSSNELINIFDEIIVFCREKFEFLKPTHEGVG